MNKNKKKFQIFLYAKSKEKQVVRPLGIYDTAKLALEEAQSWMEFLRPVQEAGEVNLIASVKTKRDDILNPFSGKLSLEFVDPDEEFPDGIMILERISRKEKLP